MAAQVPGVKLGTQGPLPLFCSFVRSLDSGWGGPTAVLSPTSCLGLLPGTPAPHKGAQPSFTNSEPAPSLGLPGHSLGPASSLAGCPCSYHVLSGMRVTWMGSCRCLGTLCRLFTTHTAPRPNRCCRNACWSVIDRCLLVWVPRGLWLSSSPCFQCLALSPVQSSLQCVLSEWAGSEFVYQGETLTSFP